MAENIKYTCSRCGKKHEEWPALAFDSPTSYNVLPDSVKHAIGELDADFCVIRHPEQTDRFIRCTLTQKINNYCEDLQYGLWVSLSEESFQDYTENFNNENHETIYFGWLSNDIPEYDFEKSIPTTVYTRTGNLRPEIIPHEGFDHPFVRDYYADITKKEAERRIKSMLRSIAKRDQPSRRIGGNFGKLTHPYSVFAAVVGAFDQRQTGQPSYIPKIQQRRS